MLLILTEYNSVVTLPMPQEYQTMKVYKESLKLAKKISAETGKTMMSIIHKMLKDEIVKLNIK